MLFFLASSFDGEQFVIRRSMYICYSSACLTMNSGACVTLTFVCYVHHILNGHCFGISSPVINVQFVY